MLIIGGYLGSEVSSFNALLASRVVEGVGYVSIAVAMPAFIGRVCSDRNRPLAMGVWGTFIPGGVALCMLIAPFLVNFGGWRALWIAGSVVALLCLALGFFTIRKAVARFSAPAVGAAPAAARPPLRSVLRRTPLILASCFALYSATFVGLTTFLPTLWSETQGIGIELATRLSALVVVMNILGNLSGGWMMSKGVALRTVLFVALVGGGLSACVVYINGAPLPLQILAAALSVYLGGMLPASLFASVSDYTESPAQAGLLLGLLFQGAAVGQVFGPVLFGAVVDIFGSWQAVPLFFITLVIAAFLLLRKLPAKGSNPRLAKTPERD